MTDEADEDRSEERAAAERAAKKQYFADKYMDTPLCEAWENGCDYGRKVGRERAAAEREALENYKCKIGKGYAIEDIAWKHGCDFGHEAEREKMSHDLEAAYLKGFVEGKEAAVKAERERVLRIAEELCKKVEGNVTHWYRGDSMNGNELLAELKQKLSEGA